ncbi:MAG: helix-turn-helix domain-containing protein, partial [Eubacteriales bacterium]
TVACMIEKCDTTRCERCQYHGYDPTLGVYCNYLMITGHLRGCDGGDACDKFTTEPVENHSGGLGIDYLLKKGNRGENNSRPRLGVRRNMKIDKQKLIELRREGKTLGGSAKVFGCSADAVRQACRKLEAEGRLTTATVSNAEDYIAEKRLQTDENEATTPCKTVAQRIAEEEEAEAAKRAEDANVLTNDDEICSQPAPVRKLPLGVIPRRMWL